MKAVSIALHDVAPATWEACQRLLDMIDVLGRLPLTFLVVPDYHGTGYLDESPRFVDALHARVAGGCEIALHGLRHVDDMPLSRSPRDEFRRRVLTNREGEFAVLDADEAERRIRTGLDCFARCGWAPAGFVAPAWLASKGTRTALRRCELLYTTTHCGIELLDSGRRITAPAISASCRSRWRAAASSAWLATAPGLLRSHAVVRLAIHPADADHPQVMRAWRDLISNLLTDRVTITKQQLLSAA